MKDGGRNWVESYRIRVVSFSFTKKVKSLPLNCFYYAFACNMLMLLSKDLIKALKEKITDLSLTLVQAYASTQLYHIYLYVVMCVYLFWGHLK